MQQIHNLKKENRVLGPFLDLTAHNQFYSTKRLKGTVSKKWNILNEISLFILNFILEQGWGMKEMKFIYHLLPWNRKEIIIYHWLSKYSYLEIYRKELERNTILCIYAIHFKHAASCIPPEYVFINDWNQVRKGQSYLV